MVQNKVKVIDYESEEEFIAPVDQLCWYQQRIIKHNEFMRKRWNEWWYPNADFQDLCWRMFDKYWYEEGTGIVNTVLTVQKEQEILDKLKKCEKTKYTNWWFITLTSKEDWSEELAKCKIDKYRQSHFKNYKNIIWVEEHGTESEKYHQHILVETNYKDQRFHTGINLKPTKYYDANINIQRVTDTYNSKTNIIKYMTKENKPQGNLTHFNLQ